MGLGVSVKTLMEPVMVFRIFLTVLVCFFCQSSEAVIVKGLSTSGLAYNTTSIPGGNPPDDPFPNGSNCFSNAQCASNYCAPSGKCEDEPVVDPGNYTIVLALGDSHVLGQLTGTTYYRGGFRFRLQAELLPTVVNMIGPQKTNPTSDSFFDVDHAGIGGQTTAQINSRVPGLITNYLSPSTCAHTVVVLEGGYNKLSVAEPAFTNQINEIKSSITRFYNFCPDMPVIFMNLKPFPSNSGPGRNDEIDTYNARLLTEMSDLQETMPNLWIWDRFATYTDPDNCGGNVDNCCQNNCAPGDTGCVSTTSHPSPMGYELDGHYLGLIIKNGCLSQYDCRPDPLP